jgi:hypothetical protein
MLAAAVLLGAPAAQAEPVVSGIEVRAPDRVTVGDRFHVIITLEGLNGTKVGLAPGAMPGEFAVVSTPQTSTKSAGNGRSTITFDLEVAAFFPGDAIIPPLVLDYEEPGGTRGQVVTPPASLFVTSVLPSDPSEFQVRDLKPQLEIGSASNLGIFVAALAFVLVALAIVTALIIRSMRPKPVPRAVEVDTAELGPEDRARAILDAAGARFAADRDFVIYYGTIAVTVRNYLTERYGFHAFALTTVELRNEMNRRGIDRWQARLVDGLLTQCDSAVYARYMPALERADHDLTAAFEIVEMSRPQPEPEPEVAAPEGVASR